MILIRDLCKQYSDFSLTISDLRLDNGYIYGLVGKNGAGKTTLIQCILGLVPYIGEISFDGHTLEKRRMDLLPKIAYVSDSLFYPTEMTGIQVRNFTRRYYPNWSEELFQKQSASFGINLRKKLKELSQGNKTKLAIALALAKQSDILILDEPTSGLDPIVRGEIIKALKEQASAREIIILFSTHILEDVIEIVDKVIPIRCGSIGPLHNIDDRSNHKDIIQSIIHAIQ